MSKQKRERIRGIEDELFSSMAKQKLPMAPGENLPQFDVSSSAISEELPWEHVDATRARLKARFPKLTDSELDEWMM